MPAWHRTHACGWAEKSCKDHGVSGRGVHSDIGNHFIYLYKTIKGLKYAEVIVQPGLVSPSAVSGTPLHVRDGNLATLMAEQGCRISSVEGVEPRGAGADELAASTRRLENTFSPGRTWPDGAAMHSCEVTELFTRPADGCSCLLDVQCPKAFNETNWPRDSLHINHMMLT